MVVLGAGAAGVVLAGIVVAAFAGVGANRIARRERLSD